MAPISPCPQCVKTLWQDVVRCIRVAMSANNGSEQTNNKNLNHMYHIMLESTARDLSIMQPLLIGRNYHLRRVIYYMCHTQRGVIYHMYDEKPWKHDDVITWKHIPHYWPFVRGIHRPPMDSPHKGWWLGVWCFLWSAPEQTVEQKIETPVIWDTIAVIMTSL